MFAEQARKDYDAMKAFKERIDKIEVQMIDFSFEDLEIDGLEFEFR